MVINILRNIQPVRKGVWRWGKGEIISSVSQCTNYALLMFLYCIISINTWVRTCWFLHFHDVDSRF